MQKVSTIHTYLKEGTRGLHDLTEDRMNAKAMMGLDYKPSEYVHFLQTQHAFHIWLSKNVEEFDSLAQDRLLNWTMRKRGHLAGQDLALLQVGPLKLEVQHNDVYSLAEVWGMLYVAEGSTLGGNFIRKALRRNPNFEGIDAYAFLGCYGEEIGSRWKEFLAALGQAHEKLGDKAAFLRGAEVAFQTLMDYAESSEGS